MPPPLVSARLRAAAATAVVIAGVVTAVLAVTLLHSGANAFDDWMLHRSVDTIGGRTGRFLLNFSEPPFTVGVIVAVAVVAALARNWKLLVLAAVGPGTAALLTEYVLKPAVGRYLFHPGLPEAFLRQVFGGAFPSGHETGVAAAALLVLIAAGQGRLGPRGRAAVSVTLLLWTGLAALGLIRNYYHYATDIVGALGVAVTVVLGGALLLDALAPPVERRFRGRRLAQPVG